MRMKLVLLPIKIFTFLLLVLFSENTTAQCAITTTTNTTALICNNAPLASCNGILYIGDGINPMTLNIDQSLDISCLGAIQLIVRNKAAISFSSGNFNLKLASGSSFILLKGSNLTGLSCDTPQRIYIGGTQIANCKGIGLGVDYNFANLVIQRGYKVDNTASKSICGSGSVSVTIDQAGLTSCEWFTAPTGGASLGSGTTLVIPLLTETTVYYAEIRLLGILSLYRTPVVVTVDPLPVITGTLNACVGTTTQLAATTTPDATTPWISATPAVATVSSTGLVTAVTVGTTEITYKNTNGCITKSTVTVNALPAISGTLTVCVNATTQLTGTATPDGTTPWTSATPAVATVSNTGLVTGHLAGTTEITYKNTNSCITKSTVTVNALPAISGTLTVCVNATTQLTGTATPDGTTPWTSATPAVATVSNTGLVTGHLAGTTEITYKNTNGCITKSTVTVNALPAITGTLTVCVNATTQLTGTATPDGTTPWTSATPAVATVSNTGLVTGHLAGTTEITHKNTNGCITKSTVTVNALPTISGILTVCVNATTQLTGTATPDGTTPWTSATPAVATVSNTGLVTGHLAGTTEITYKNTNGCITKSTVTVNTLPTISGTLTICVNATTQLAGTATPDGTTPWTSATPAVATVSSTGLVTGHLAGTSEVTYKNTNGCTVKTTVTVNALPNITTHPISQLDCEGNSDTFKVVATGLGTLTYIWERKRPAESVFTAIAPGETNIVYPNPGEIKIEYIGSAQAPDGTQYRVVVSNGICSVTSNPATLLVNEIKEITSPSLTPSQSVMDVTLCYGSSYSYTVSTSYPTNVVSYQWKRSVSSGVWTDVLDGGVFSGAKTASLSISSGTPTESAAYRVYVVFHSSGADCTVDSRTRTRKLTFLPLLLTPVVAIIQPDCMVATGTLTVAVQSTDDVYSFNNGDSFQASNSKSGLVAGSYTVIIKNKAGCLSTTTNCDIKAAVTSTWNGVSWLPSKPTKEDRIVFTGDYLPASETEEDLEGCSCELQAGVKVTIRSGKTLSITNALTVNTAVGTTLAFENNASLWQENDAAENTGTIIYKRKSSKMKDLDYTYWSSPVKGQNTKLLSPNTQPGKFYFFANNNWQAADNRTMDPGRGYIIRTPKAGTWGAPGDSNYEVVSFPYAQAVQFVGTPNNGDQIKFTVDPNVGVENLIGNPYPSALDANAFLLENQAVLEGTIYFWTHNTAIQLASNITNGSAGTGANAYTSDDYAAYNSLGGVSAESNPDTNNPANGYQPLGKIAAGQSFMAITKAAGVVSFKNNMREKASNTQFFKQTKNAKTMAAGRQRVWLNLTNTQGAFKQTLIGYVKGATNGYEDLFDGINNNGNSFVDFYSINDNNNLVIQGRALPFDPADIVPLGYSSKIEGTFAISIDQVDGDLSNQPIFIEDKETQAIHNLKSSPYSFNTKKGIFNERFVLRYTDKTLNSDDFETVENKVIVTAKNKQLNIYSAVEAIDKVLIYDLSGKKIIQKTNINELEYTVVNLVSKQQSLLVKVVLKNGQIVTNKIVY
jgi:uncharacterized protein YjdB